MVLKEEIVVQENKEEVLEKKMEKVKKSAKEEKQFYLEVNLCSCD